MSNNDIHRNYNVSDPEMLQHSRVTKSIFIEDKETFAQFDADFADPFADNWGEAISLGETLAGDSQQLSRLREKTEAIVNLVSEAESLMKDLKYYLEKAYPGQKSTWARFGFGEFRKVRKNQEKMVRALALAYLAASETPDNLTAAGFTQEKIDRLNSLSNELASADTEQEKIKKLRPDKTVERIKVLNDCYEYLKKVHKASIRIFEDNKTKLEQYKLPYENHVVKEPEEETAGT